MRFLLYGKQQYVGQVFGITGGVQCDEIVFSRRDIANMVKADPVQLQLWLAERVQCRFVPNSIEHKTLTGS